MVLMGAIVVMPQHSGRQAAVLEAAHSGLLQVQESAGLLVPAGHSGGPEVD
jgi:hypothetical protein